MKYYKFYYTYRGKTETSVISAYDDFHSMENFINTMCRYGILPEEITIDDIIEVD